MIGYITLGVLLFGVIIYIIYEHSNYSTKKLKDEFKVAIKKVGKAFEDEKNFLKSAQVKEIEEEIEQLKNQLEFNKISFFNQKKDWEDQLFNIKEEYLNKKKAIEKSIEEQYQNSQKDLVERLSNRQTEIENEVHKLEDKYNLTIQDYEHKMFDIQCKFEEEEKALTQRVEEKKNEINILIEQFKKDEEARKEADFYRIPISSAAKNDIDKLKSVAAQLNNPITLNKFIYKEYYEASFNAMCGRVLGENAEKSGIYKITNIKNQMCYIGQTKAGFKNRWRTHVKRGLGCEEQTNNRLYTGLKEDGLENFTFQILEICEEKILTERERFYINFYDSKNWGYNSKM